MELAIVFGIAAAGYGLSLPGKEQRYDDDVVAADALAPRQPRTVAQAQAVAAEAATQRWRQASDPAASGVVSGAAPRGWSLTPPMPQHTREPLPTFRQARMELFTGVPDPTMLPTARKDAVGPLFRPADSAVPVTSSGTAGNPQLDLPAPFVSDRQHNVVPTPQVRVGRGVGVGPGVPAAGGFHSLYRVNVANVGAYQRNGDIMGRAVPGASPIDARPVAPSSVPQNHPARYWDTDTHRPPMASRADVTAPAPRSELPRAPRATGRAGEEPYLGVATSSVPALRAPDSSVVPTREHNHRSDVSGMPVLNVSDAASQSVGGFVSAHFDPSRLEAQHRETAGWSGMPTGGATAPTAGSAFLVPPTMRDLHAPASSGYLGAAGSYVPCGTAPLPDAPAPTLRDRLQSRAPPPGIAAPTGALAPMDRTGALAPDRQAKGHLVPGRFNAPSIVRTDGLRVQGQVQLRQGELENRVLSHGTSFGPQFMQPGLATTTHNKLPELNPRLDLDLAKRQLRDNDLAIKWATLPAPPST